MPPTQPNNDAWLAQQLKQLKVDVAALKAHTATLASVSTALFQPARAYRNAALTTGTAGTNIVLPIDTVDYDLTNGAMDVTNHWFKCPVAGYYFLAGNISISTASDGFVSLFGFAKNGSMAIWAGGNVNATTSSESIFSGGSTIMGCAAGDELQLMYQTNVAGDSFEAAPSTNWLTVMRVA